MNGKKKQSSPLLAVVILILVGIISSISEDPDSVFVIIPLVVVAVVAFVLVSLFKEIKKSEHTETYSKPSKKVEHSHDRLTNAPDVIEHCEGLEHYKKQLDGFLSCGVIDRSEYRVLLDKYSRQLGTKY